MEIRKIDSSMALQLSELAKRIYKEHYLHLWEPGGAEWYQDIHAYHPDKLWAELEDSNNLHFMVFEEGQPIGYLKLCINASLTGFDRFDCMEIERIYLHKHASGRGIGKQLMQLSETIASQHSKEVLFLKAMDSSIEALSFYQKMGYETCGDLVLPFVQMKDAYRGMSILCKHL